MRHVSSPINMVDRVFRLWRKNVSIAQPVALAAGVHASRLDGSPLRYNNPDPYLPDLLVCHPALADTVLAAVASFEG